MVVINKDGKWRIRRPDETLLHDEFETKQAAQHRADLIRVLFYAQRLHNSDDDNRRS